jgi:pantetheine-phosphate adenylyltransferase
MSKKNMAVYPGSYDPLTNGHIDIIERGLKIFDKVVVAVLKNPAKTYLFDLEERCRILDDVFRGNERIEVAHFEGLLVDFVKQRGITTIARGLRAISDFEIEFQMALMNRKIEPLIETVFFVPCEAYSFLSSKLVKEIYMLGGEVPSMLPAAVARRLKEKFSQF